MSTHAIGKITVLIVNDHPLLRAGIRAILEKTSDIDVVGEAGGGDDAGKLLEDLHPPVILLDPKMPGFSASAFVKWARDNYPETITLVLTAHDRDAYLANMMDANAVGYFDIDVRAEQLIGAIRRAASGGRLFDEQQKRRAQKWHEDVEKKWNSLSERERQILRLMADGASNKEISSKLNLAESTVEKHLEKIYEKLGVTSRPKAVLWGIKNCMDFPY